jgi:hypothetical protein
MKAPSLSQADNIAKVNRQRQRQDQLLAEQRAQMDAAERIANAVSDFRDMGTTDAHAPVVNNVDTTMINAVNLSRDTESRAMEVMNEQRAEATTADGHARSAQHNSRLISNVGQAMDTVLSGQQAQAIQVSIVREEQHQTQVRDTSTQNAAELQDRTRQAVEYTDAVRNRVHNIILPD